jgi:hypothetical protein
MSSSYEIDEGANDIRLPDKLVYDNAQNLTIYILRV